MPLTACRVCASGELAPILSLGPMPLANALVSRDHLAEPDARVPLDLAFCGRCSLVQITETVPPEDMFRHYLYFSSFSDSFVAHAARLAERVVEERGLTASSTVVEIGSNDGYLLQNYVTRGIRVLGIEPARNVAAVARRDRHVPTLCEFFNAELAARLVAEGTRADVIHAHNVLAHVPNPADVVAGIGRLLADTGVAIVEVPYLRDFVDNTEFDTIYHEHLCYFSLTALTRLLQPAGLQVTDVAHLMVHGGSLRLFIHRHGSAPVCASVGSLLAAEAAWGVSDIGTYRRFETRVHALREEVRALVTKLRCAGKRIAAYGAAAKGTILLNYLGLGSDVVDFVADRSEHKQGHFLPGVRIPVLPPEALVDRMPDYVLLLVWNLSHEVLGQQEEYRRRGGRFIVPIPAVVVL